MGCSSEQGLCASTHLARRGVLPATQIYLWVTVQSLFPGRTILRWEMLMNINPGNNSYPDLE